MSDYMSELSQATGLQYYPKQGPFARKDGAVIGARDGFLIAAGPTRDDRSRSAIGVLIRFAGTATPDQIKAAFKANKGFPSRMDIKAGSGFATLKWGYSFGKHKAADVANVIGAAVETAKSFAAPLDGRCEKCQGSSKQEIVLLDGSPSYFCYGCQQRLQQELDRAGQQYDELPANYPRGLIYGVVAALLGSLAWGGVAFAAKKIFLYGAIGIGIMIGWAVAKGVGKVDRTVQALGALLTIASVIAGDAFFYSLAISSELHVAWGTSLLGVVFKQLWELEKGPTGLFTLGFAVLGAVVAFARLRRPKFKVKFERLGSPVT